MTDPENAFTYIDETVRFSYEPAVDTLYIHFGDIHPAVSVEWCDGVFVRQDPVTGTVHGLQIEGFMTRLTKER